MKKVFSCIIALALVFSCCSLGIENDQGTTVEFEPTLTTRHNPLCISATRRVPSGKPGAALPHRSAVAGGAGFARDILLPSIRSVDAG